MKTKYQNTKKGKGLTTALASAMLPFLFLLVSVDMKSQCAVTGTPGVINGCQYNDQIDTFTLNAIASPVSPGCSSGAYLYSSLPNWQLLMGSTYNFTATVGGNVYQEGVAIWIDLNQDGNFTASEQMISVAPALVSVGSFSIPYTATPGTTRMRVRDSYYTTIPNGATSACDAFTYGETEDYLITLIAPTPCSGTPGANTAVLTPTGLICPGAAATVSLSSTYTVGGISYAWQSSTVSAVGPWSPISTTAVPTATAPSLNTPTMNVNTYYQCVITCSNGGGSVTATAATASIAAVSLSTVPYYENFESISLNNQLPNCSWTKSGTNAVTMTYIQAQNQNRVPRSGSKFASFYYTPGNTNYFYTNGIQLKAGVTYSASVWYTTEYYGYTNWTDLSIMLGTSQSTTGLVTIASSNGPALSPSYKSLSNTFTVATSGTYYVAIKGTSNGSCCGYYLSWDDLSIIAPCNLNPVTVTTNASNGTVCQGNPVTITASGADTYSWSPNGAVTAAITVTPNSNTTYYVTGTNSLTNCFSTVSQNIIVNPAPVVSAFADNNTICKGSTANLFAYGASLYQWSTGTSAALISVSPTVTTTYSVVGTNTYACTGTGLITINVNPLPNVVPASTSNNLCVGETVTLSATGAVSYAWSSNNLFVQSQSAVVSPVVNTTYMVSGTDANGCVNTASITLSVSGCVGLKEVSTASGVKVYPNPNNGEFTVELPNTSIKTIVVVDVTGRMVQSVNNTNNKVNFNLNNLANGIYYVKLISEKSAEVVKIVKQ